MTPECPFAGHQPNDQDVTVSLPLCNSSLPTAGQSSAYVDVFVDIFIALDQGQSGGHRVRQILLRAIDDVILPLDVADSKFRGEPVSLKKLRKGDCSCSTTKLVLGWIIGTEAIPIHLAPHRVKHPTDVLASIPITQKRTSVKK